MSEPPARLIVAAAMKHVASFFEEFSKKMQSPIFIEALLAEHGEVASAATLVSAPDVKTEAAIASPKKKRGKRKRDPDEPKRADTAFILHNRKYSSVLKKERPGEKITMSFLAKHWKEMDGTDEKAEFITKAKELKVEELKKRQAYQELKASRPDQASPALAAKDEPISAPKQKKVKKERDPLQPKRPLSGFLRHNGKYRSILKAQHPKAGNKDMMKILAAHWHEYPKAEKEKFQSVAQKEMAEFKIAYAAYKSGKASKAPAPAQSGTAPEQPSGKKQKKKKKSKDMAATLTATPAESETSKKRKKKRKKSTKKKKPEKSAVL